MRDLISHIISNRLVEAKGLFENRIKELFEQKIDQLKMHMVAEMYGEIDVDVELDEATRTKIITRVRKGKVQRRKKVSNVSGYTLRGGRLVRMSSAERRHRKMAARRAKFKRRAKLRQSLRKRSLSLKRRGSLGL